METNGTLPDWFPTLEAVVSYTCMGFVALTLPLYTLVVTIMILLRKRAYHGMFYRIFMVGGVIDILALTNNYLGAIFPAKSWFAEFYLSHGTLFGHMYLIIAWGTRFSQGLTVTLLALNRATAVVSPMKHKQIWRSPWANIVIVLQISFGCVIGAFLVPQEFFWKKQDNGYYIQFADTQFRTRYFTIAYSLDTLFVLVIIITNATMIWVFRKKYRTRTLTTQSANLKVLSEKQRQENYLCIISSVTCLVEVTYYCYIVYAFLIQPYTNTKVFYLIYNALNDIYGGIGAWLIVGLSSTLRQHIRNLVCCCVKRKKKAQSSSLKIPLSSMTAITAPGHRPSKKNTLFCTKS